MRSDLSSSPSAATSHSGGPPQAQGVLGLAGSLRRLIDSLNREQRRHQELLASLGFALRSCTNINRFLELVTLVAARLVQAEEAVLLVFHADGRLWRDHLQATPSPGAASVVRQLAALADGQLQIQPGDQLATAHLDQHLQRLWGAGRLEATSVVARGHCHARLYVFSAREGFSWSEVHRRHLQLVADLTAVALENELLAQELRRHERLDRQLSIGAEIQAQLLPDDCPLIEGVELAARCRPAFQVGGDYYDFIPTKPQLQGPRRQRGRWALVIGDVMGKGVPASLLMTMLRGMLRAGVLSGHAPNRILRDLNEIAQEDLDHSHRFLSLFYSDYHPRSRLLRYANAAHNPPLLWRCQQGVLQRLDAPGLLIGLQREVAYGMAQTVLEPGDVLLYYTDGVTEAVGFSGERFEEQRLERALVEVCRQASGAQEILDHLFARLDRFVGEDRQLEDDASMVVLKVREQLGLPQLPPPKRVSS